VNRRFFWVLLIVVLVNCVVFFRWYRERRERRFDPQIQAAAQRYQIDAALIKAVIWRESDFNPGARGRAGELGLMQIRPPAAQEWVAAERVRGFEFEHLADPGTNTLVGTWYLAKLLKRYSGSKNPLPYALADYNAGRTHVLRWMKDDGRHNPEVFLKQMDFPGTRHYIAAVTEQYEIYRRKMKR
jgi:soluble lytic murein transglycosylase